ncbi:MAG: hypothetical protein NT056_03305 [Proteobacteria bacterium]|nr:hypothetical protein [Pseudomonadota bacterium]
MSIKNKLIISIFLILIFQIPLYADICPTETLKNKFQKLSFKDLKNDMDLITKAANETINSSLGENEKCREKLLHVFREYYFDALNKSIKNGSYLGPNYDEEEIDKSKEKKINSHLSKVGWTLKESERMFYVGESGGWFENKFAKILTQPYREYFNLRSKEINEGFSEDAGLLISWEQLRNRIIKWESFLLRYSDFVENLGIKEYQDIYIRTYLSGIDNSTIENDGGVLLKEVKNSYENFLKENKNSKYFNIVKDCYGMLKNNKFVINKNYLEFLEKSGYRTMRGIQPPTY